MERTLTAIERIRNSAAKAGVVVNEVTPKRGRGLVVFHAAEALATPEAVLVRASSQV